MNTPAIARDRDIYAIQLEGRVIYQLLRLLEEDAVGGESFCHVRQCVLVAEAVRTAARAEGWGQGRPYPEETI